MALYRISDSLAHRRIYKDAIFQLGNAKRSYSEDPAPNPVRVWKTWKDVPDNLVKTYSERDPYNMVYQEKNWIILKKKQLWATQDLNVNPEFVGGKRDYYLVLAAAFGLFCLGVFTWYQAMEEDFVTYSKKVKEMRSNPPDWRTPADKRGLVFCESS